MKLARRARTANVWNQSRDDIAAMQLASTEPTDVDVIKFTVGFLNIKISKFIEVIQVK